MERLFLVFIGVMCGLCFSNCSDNPTTDSGDSASRRFPLPDTLTEEMAARIWALPTHCLTVEYPNKLGQVLGSAADLKGPKTLRPVFYGCFDWHSAVHGYWSIAKLLKLYPHLDQDSKVRSLLNTHITPENIAVEMAFFQDENNLSFERTYGWAWLFKLQQELLSWDDKDARRWATVLQPLVDLLSERTQVYLTKLVYPIRTGQHDNTAFSLSMMLDYANASKDVDLASAIKANATRLYERDKNCSLSYEPSGYDFLSPCLEEAWLMSKVMDKEAYTDWLLNFLPGLFEEEIAIQPAIVSDRTDGKLVHLDGLNFSRAHCFYGLAQALPELRETLVPLGNKHLNFSLQHIAVDDDYMGSHWLGSFALLALSND